jgi:hypothetical protein
VQSSTERARTANSMLLKQSQADEHGPCEVGFFPLLRGPSGFSSLPRSLDLDGPDYGCR